MFFLHVILYSNLVFLALFRINLHLFMSSILIHFYFIPSLHPLKIQRILASLLLLPYIAHTHEKCPSSALKQNQDKPHINRIATTFRVFIIPIITNNNDHV